MNTNIRSTALGILEDAEQSLRELISQAALEQRYDELTWLVELARHVALIRESNDAVIHHGESATKERSTTSDAVMPQEPVARRRRQGSYPRFHAENDRLVKTGWSKKSRTEYEHRAPKETVERIFDAVSIVSQEGSFDVDAISALVVTESDPTPNYQIYLAIGWLRANGYLVKRGRSEYAVAKSIKNLDFQNLWKPLSLGNEA